MGFVLDEATVQPLAAVDVDQQGVGSLLQLRLELGGVEGAGGLGMVGRGAAIAAQPIAVGGEQRRFGCNVGKGGQCQGKAGQAGEKALHGGLSVLFMVPLQAYSAAFGIRR
ncbi:hypothetical protein D9M68_366010 [compost metagenome]